MAAQTSLFPKSDSAIVTQEAVVEHVCARAQLIEVLG